MFSNSWFTYTPPVERSPQPCTCGAKHTSFPTHHSDWCDVKRPSLPRSYKDLSIVYVDNSIIPGLMLDAKTRTLFINEAFFIRLSSKEQTAMLENEYEHYRQQVKNAFNIKLSSLQVP